MRVLDTILKQHLEMRILQEHVLAQTTISRFIRSRHKRLKFSFFRKIGLFEATIYFESKRFSTNPESPAAHYLCPDSVEVCVFGEFSPLEPWSVFVPCVYDPQLQCFKVDIMIRVGQQFKFVISPLQGDPGSPREQHAVSDRYPYTLDNYGNVSNVFIPKLINRGYNEKSRSRNRVSGGPRGLTRNFVI